MEYMYDQNLQSNNNSQPPPTQPIPPMSSFPSNQAQTAKKRGTTKLIAILILIIIIAAIVFILPKSLSSNVLYQIISSNRTMPLNTFSRIAYAKYVGINQLNISYSGLITLNTTSAGTSITMKIPLKIDLVKYNSDARIEMNMSNLPLVGNVTTIYILNNSKLYTCNKISLSNLFGVNSFSYNSSYQCQPPVPVPNINSTLLNKSIGNIHFTSVSQSKYNGYGCVRVSGYVNLNASELNLLALGMSSTSSSAMPAGTNFNTSFTMCLSDTYYLPLTLFFKGKISNSTTVGVSNVYATVVLQLNETSIKNTSISQSITALPGPVVNMSHILPTSQFNLSTSTSAHT